MYGDLLDNFGVLFIRNYLNIIRVFGNLQLRINYSLLHRFYQATRDLANNRAD